MIAATAGPSGPAVFFILASCGRCPKRPLSISRDVPHDIPVAWSDVPRRANRSLLVRAETRGHVLLPRSTARCAPTGRRAPQLTRGVARTRSMVSFDHLHPACRTNDPPTDTACRTTKGIQSTAGPAASHSTLFRALIFNQPTFCPQLHEAEPFFAASDFSCVRLLPSVLDNLLIFHDSILSRRLHL